MFADGPVVERVRGVGSTVAGTASGMSAQRIAGSHWACTAPGIAAQWLELVDRTPITPAVRYGGLTLSDSALCGGVVGI